MSRMSDRFELSRNDGAGNVRPMEGLRGFAVFLVFLVHYATLMAPWISRGTPLAAAAAAVHAVGNAGVDLFFVLSGYLIYGSLISRHRPFLPFIWRRVVRIYPAFLVVFATYLILSFLHPGASKLPAGGPAAALYILENVLLLPGIFRIEPIISVAWTLSYEMFYYLTLPAIVLFLGMRARSRTWRVIFFIALAAVIIIAGAAYEGPIRLAMFVAGILLHEAISTRMPVPRTAFVTMLSIASLLFITAPFIDPIAWAARICALFCALFFLCLHCFTMPNSLPGRTFSLAPLRWLGNMSYSYYLVHGLALKMLVVILLTTVPSVTHETAFVLLMLPLAFLLTLFPSAALFLLVEKTFSLKPRTRLPAMPVAVQSSAVL